MAAADELGIGDILSVIQRRTSVRGYADDPVPRSQLDDLMAYAESVDRLIADPARIVLVREKKRTQHILTSIVGSYGLIRNAPHLLAGVLPLEAGLARLDLGYALQQVVLKATEMGLGTCWITGSFSPERTSGTLGLGATEVAAAVCALGCPAQGGWNRLHSRAIHKALGAHRRKPLEQIVFSERWGEPWLPNSTDQVLAATLAHARLAPSAANQQPWRFIAKEDGLAIALVRPAPIDAGIVMAHVALASAALGREGRWEVWLGEAALAARWGLPQGTIPVAVFRW